MAEKRTRYNELLGVDNAVRDPDLYQLLALDRVGFDPAAVDVAYREQMSKLQRIRSPKHKSFIEFLKGELRRARGTLTNAKRRSEYDEEVLEERREQLTMILDVVLADGMLSATEEERLCGIAAEVGLLPHETERVLSEELASRGATRGSAVVASPSAAPAPPTYAPPPAAPTQPTYAPQPQRTPTPSPPSTRRRSVADVVAPTNTFGGGSGSFFPTASPAPAPASDSDIQRAIQDKLRPTTRRRPLTPPSEEIVTAELVEEPKAPRASPRPTSRPTLRPPTGRTPQPPARRAPQPTPAPQQPAQQPAGWAQQARPAKSTGWGKATQVRQIGVCTGCLTPVTDQQLTAKQAERFADGRIHCPACTNRLIAGLVCGRCYNRITRAEMKGRDLVIEAGRVSHGRCVR